MVDHFHPIRQRARVDEIAAALAPDDWRCLSAGFGSKGPRLYNWAAVALKVAESTSWRHYLVIRRSL